ALLRPADRTRPRADHRTISDRQRRLVSLARRRPDRLLERQRLHALAARSRALTGCVAARARLLFCRPLRPLRGTELMFVGVDIGGTFTDLVVSDRGTLRLHKLLSTPDDPARAMLAGLHAVSPAGLEAFARVSHGTTVATNAILERKGAKAALITTQG